jgi:hypothetical protein
MPANASKIISATGESTHHNINMALQIPGPQDEYDIVRLDLTNAIKLTNNKPEIYYYNQSSTAGTERKNQRGS